MLSCSPILSFSPFQFSLFALLPPKKCSSIHHHVILTYAWASILPRMRSLLINSLFLHHPIMHSVRVFLYTVLHSIWKLSISVFCYIYISFSICLNISLLSHTLIFTRSLPSFSHCHSLSLDLSLLSLSLSLSLIVILSIYLLSLSHCLSLSISPSLSISHILSHTLSHAYLILITQMHISTYTNIFM